MEDSSPSTRDIRRDQTGQTTCQRWLRFFKSQHSAHQATTGCVNDLRLRPATRLRFFKSYVRRTDGLTMRQIPRHPPSLGSFCRMTTLGHLTVSPLTPSTML